MMPVVTYQVYYCTLLVRYIPGCHRSRGVMPPYVKQMKIEEQLKCGIGNCYNRAEPLAPYQVPINRIDQGSVQSGLCTEGGGGCS